MRSVYLDHSASTPLDPRVFEEMKPFFTDFYANPSSFHMPGKRVRDAVDSARERIAKVMLARADEILFTSGGTESVNMGIIGAALALEGKGKYVISCTTEHEATLEALEELKRRGFEVTLLPVDREGRLSPKDVIAALRPDTILVSLMLANNEIGVIHDIAEIGAGIEAYRKEQKTAFPLFHTDACQAGMSQDLSVSRLHVDLLSFNGSKIYGPKGIGALYVKRGVKLKNLHFGGSQEEGKRPGTENVPGIVGLASALLYAQEEREVYRAHLEPLRDRLIEGLLTIPKTRLNGPRDRLANNVNISFMDVEGEALVLYLDANGIAVSTGSACTSKSLDPSHVILALGVPYEVAHGSIRFSLGKMTTKEDIEYVLEVLPPLVEKLRKISPVRVDEKYF